MSEYAVEPEAPPEAAPVEPDLSGGEEWSVDDDFGPDPNADLGYGGGEQMLPVEIAELVDETLREQVGPAVQEMMEARLAPYQEALAWTQERQASEAGNARAQEIVDEIAQQMSSDAELDAEELLVETDQFFENCLGDPNLREQFAQVLAAEPDLAEQMIEEVRGSIPPEQYQSLLAAAEQGDPEATEALELAAMFTPAVAEFLLRGQAYARVEKRPRDERELLAKYNGLQARPQPQAGAAKNERELLARWMGR
jgi:hypothetical protein